MQKSDLDMPAVEQPLATAPSFWRVIPLIALTALAFICLGVFKAIGR